jgi:hypothetical protein
MQAAEINLNSSEFIMIKFSCFVVIAISGFQLWAQSYEGVINNNLTIWLDLNPPDSKGAVTGSYFYEKFGEDIRLSGKIANNTVSLNELDKKNVAQGIFNLVIIKDSLNGTWKKIKGRSSLPVKLWKADPANRKFAKARNGKELILLDGSTLADQLSNYTGEGYLDENENPTNRPPDVNICHAEGNVLSTSFFWSYMGAYPSGGVVYHTFDLVSKKEISLWDEIDKTKFPAFNSYFCVKIQPFLDETRKSYSDSEWIETFNNFNANDADNTALDEKGMLDARFSAKDLRTCSSNSAIQVGTNFFLGNDSLHFSITWYFGFPHVIQAMDVGGEVLIPYGELKKYLKKGSVLQTLSSKK